MKKKCSGNTRASVEQHHRKLFTTGTVKYIVVALILSGCVSAEEKRARAEADRLYWQGIAEQVRQRKETDRQYREMRSQMIREYHENKQKLEEMEPDDPEYRSLAKKTERQRVGILNVIEIDAAIAEGDRQEQLNRQQMWQRFEEQDRQKQLIDSIQSIDKTLKDQLWEDQFRNSYRR